jgi:hypothetical protein
VPSCIFRRGGGDLERSVVLGDDLLDEVHVAIETAFFDDLSNTVDHPPGSTLLRRPPASGAGCGRIRIRV